MPSLNPERPICKGPLTITPHIKPPFDERDAAGPCKARGLSALEVFGMGLLLFSPFILVAGGQYLENRDPKVIAQKAYILRLEKQNAELIAEILKGRK